MTAVFTILLLLAASGPLTLEQIRADPSLEHRARSAIEFAAAAERNAETAYSNNDMPAVGAALKQMVEGMEVARQALAQTGKSPVRHPGPFKSAEMRSREILIRLGDLEHKMDADERGVLQSPRTEVQEIHDSWFEGIMGKKR